MLGFTILWLLAQSQTTFYDAINLSRATKEGGKFSITTENQKIVFAILRNYLNEPLKSDSELTYDQVKSEFKGNDFIYFRFSMNIDESSIVGTNPGMGIFSNITPLADGLTKFLIKRGKEEMFISVISRLQDDKKFPELRILFPNTKVLIDNFNSWEYANFINTMKEAFDKDFKMLLEDIPKLRTLSENDTLSTDANKRIRYLKSFLNGDEGRILLSTFVIANGFISQQKLPDMIHEVADTSYLGGLQPSNPDIRNAIRLFDILSYSVRSNEYGKHYISFAEFRDLMNDSTARNIFFGLIYQQLKNEDIVINHIHISNLLQPNSVSGVQRFIENLLSSYIDVDLAYKELNEAKKKGETDLTPYWGAIFFSANDFLQEATNIQIIDQRLRFPDKLQNVFTASQKTLQIAHDISVRNYSAVIVGTINYISETFPTSEASGGFKVLFVKYGSFAANVVQAKNSDDVEKAIESVALPVGSATIKKRTSFNIALNGYLGGFYGNEFLKASPGRKWAPITGVYAPIGVTISKGLGRGGSISLFGSIIDLGAFASYRLQDDTTKTLPEVSLKNILAPGGGVIYGLPWLPISVGYTWQLGPMLREINSDSKNASDKMNHRWQFFLAVDIPIVNFYTNSKLK